VRPFMGHLLTHGQWAGSRAIEFGRTRYRLLWDVSEGDRRIIFRTVGPRSNVYEQPKPLERGERSGEGTP
jgi:hypothetical protein